MSTDTRDRILQAATDVFTTKGYSGSGINEILKAADVPKGSFYHFFESKEALAVAVLEAHVASHAAWLEKGLTAGRSPLKALETTLGGARDMLRARDFEGGCLLGSLAQELADSGAPISNTTRGLFSRWEQQFRACIDAAKRAGELPRRADSGELSGFLLDGWEGALLRARVEKSTAPLDRFIKHVIRYLKSL